MLQGGITIHLRQKRVAFGCGGQIFYLFDSFFPVQSILESCIHSGSAKEYPIDFQTIFLQVSPFLSPFQYRTAQSHHQSQAVQRNSISNPFQIWITHQNSQNGMYKHQQYTPQVGRSTTLGLAAFLPFYWMQTQIISILLHEKDLKMYYLYVRSRLGPLLIFYLFGNQLFHCCGSNCQLLRIIVAFYGGFIIRGCWMSLSSLILVLCLCSLSPSNHLRLSLTPQADLVAAEKNLDSDYTPAQSPQSSQWDLHPPALYSRMTSNQQNPETSPSYSALSTSSPAQNPFYSSSSYSRSPAQYQKSYQHWHQNDLTDNSPKNPLPNESTSHIKPTLKKQRLSMASLQRNTLICLLAIVKLMNLAFAFGFFNVRLLVTLLLDIRFVRVGFSLRWNQILHHHRNPRRIRRVSREGDCSSLRILDNTYLISHSTLSPRF